MEKPATEAKASSSSSSPAADAAQREAKDYYGYLIKKDKSGTDTFNRLLKGIAKVISTEFQPSDSPDLTPVQLAAFYRAVGGDYDVLFIDTPPSSISFIYRSLGAFHSLQPAPEDDGYSIPTIPALKPKGFVTWQTIQLLLGPEHHVPFLQKAVEIFDVKDPETGNVFPKILPKECFPDRPDDAMEQWYESVADRLRKAAEREAAEKQEAAGVRVDVDEPQPRSSSETSGDERHAAASYFADPLYRNRVRPGYMRHFSKGSVYSEDRGGLVGRVRHVLNFNPFHDKERERRRPSPSKYPHDDYVDVDATPIATVPPQHTPSHHHRYSAPSHKRPQPPRRESSLPTTDSESDDARPRSRSSPVLRHRRSHDPPATTPRDYFPPYYDERERRYSHDVTPESRRKSPDRPPPPLYGPTQTPLFATHVAKMQAQNYVYDRRPAPASARGSYRSNTGVRYTVSPPDPDPTYLRERERKPAEPEPVYTRDRDRSRDEYGSHSSSSRHRSEMSRRRSDEYPNERDSRGRPDSLRSIRSHDRVKDEWDGRDLSRERERDRDGRVRARYVSSSSSTQDGVGGRRYPAPEPAWR